MPRMADDTPARPFDRGTRILLELPAKLVIGSDEVPSVEPEPDERRGDTSRIRVCVIGPVKAGAGAILACEVATPAGNGDGDATVLSGQLLAGQRNARVRHIEDRPNVFIVKPLRRQGRSDVDLVLVIPEQDTNLLAEHLAAKVLHCHFRGSDGTCSGECCKQAAPPPRPRAP